MISDATSSRSGTAGAGFGVAFFVSILPPRTMTLGNQPASCPTPSDVDRLDGYRTQTPESWKSGNTDAAWLPSGTHSLHLLQGLFTSSRCRASTGITHSLKDGMLLAKNGVGKTNAQIPVSSLIWQKEMRTHFFVWDQFFPHNVT